MEDGGPSVTARRVATHRLGFTRLPAAYGDPAADEALAVDVAAGSEVPASRMHDYLAARTSFFDRIVVAAIGRGVRQIVVGGAGYDGRALRYAKPGVRWFEVDDPATQRDKRERLERLGIAVPHVRFVAADFSKDPVADRLLAAGLDAGAPGLFLLEGVAVYLEPAVLETVLEQFREVAAAGSRLAISVSLSRDHDVDARARFQASVAAMGEPARSALDAAEAEDLLARTGWRIMAVNDNPDDLEATARRERRRSAGLLLTSAGPRSPRAARRPRKSGSILTHPAPQPQASLSLSALLSQALVAFTIAFDNEAEHRIPHRTTNFGAASHGDGAWLVSMVMWENCMRFVTDEPITVGELLRLARTGTNLDGMRRWGYVTIDGTAKVHKGHPGPDAISAPRPGACGRGRYGGRFPASSSSAGGSVSAPGRWPGCGTRCWPWSACSTPGCPIACRSSARACSAGDRIPRSRRGRTTWISPTCRCQRCCPGYCCRSPSSTSGNRRGPSPSAPTCCASSTRKERGFATFRR